MRVIFPLLLRKDGKPRKRQKPVKLFLNGERYLLKRGEVLDVPRGVVPVADGADGYFKKKDNNDYECFISNRERRKS